MGTELSGVELSGLTMDGDKTFASIPGLIQLNEMDFEVLTVVNGADLDIRRVGDKSGHVNTIEGDSAARRSQLVTFSGSFKSMRTSSNNRWSKNITKFKWTEVIRQNPFGIFALYARNSTGNVEFMMKHGGNVANKFWFWVNNLGSLKHTFRNASNVETEWGSANGEVAVDGSAQAIDLVGYGLSEAIKMEMFVNTVSKATRTTSNIIGTETANTEFRMMESGTVGSIQDLIMFAVYDWTGYTKTQVQDFIIKVNAIREEKYGSIF